MLSINKLLGLLLLLPAFHVWAIDGLSERFDISFSYDEGFDAIGTPAFEAASLAHNIQLSTLSDCYFMWVPDSPE